VASPAPALLVATHDRTLIDLADVVFELTDGRITRR
jgi:ABC-type lipoprotein export system ATPase subunit